MDLSIAIEVKPGLMGNHFSWFWLMILVAGCSPVIGNHPLGPTPAASDIPAKPTAPAIVGNGEPYNGPHFQALSLPVYPDEKMDWGRIHHSVDLCLQRAGHSLIAQLYGEQVIPGKSSLRFQPIGSTFRATSEIDFKLGTAQLPYRLSLEADLALASPLAQPKQPLRVRSHSLVLANHETKEWNLQSSDPMPALKLTFSQPLPLSEAEPTDEIEIDKTWLIGSKNGPAFSALVDVNTGEDSGAAINLQWFGACLEMESLSGEDFIFNHPSGQAPDLQTTEPAVEFGFKTEILPRIELRREQQSAIWSNLRSKAQQWYEEYRRQGWSENRSRQWNTWCDAKNRTNHISDGLQCAQLLHQLSLVFKQATQLELAQLGPHLNSIAELLKIDSENPQPLSFRLGLSRPTFGYHRGTFYLAMNLQAVAADDFMVFYLHNLIHRNDSGLVEATTRYRKIWEAVEIDTLDLSSPQNVEQLIDAGLRRGLIAEWVASVSSLAVYRAAVLKGLWKQNRELDAVLPAFDCDNPLSLDLKRPILEMLLINFKDPQFNFFALPLFKTVLQNNRRAIQANPDSLSLGGLEAVYQKALSDTCPGIVRNE